MIGPLIIKFYPNLYLLPDSFPELTKGITFTSKKAKAVQAVWEELEEVSKFPWDEDVFTKELLSTN